MSTTNYGTAVVAWRENAKVAWCEYTHHPFVEGIKDGSLPRECFLHYLRQDYVYLVHYSRAWGLAIAKSETLAEMKSASATVNALVNHEMQMHVETCAEEGISEDELINTFEATENLAYTRYLLEAGYSGDYLDLMAALAPCAIGYGEIGERLGREITSNEYRPWIETYADKEYQDICFEVGALIDQSLTQRLGDNYQSTPRWKRLSNHFETATRLETNFWNMGWNYKSS